MCYRSPNSTELNNSKLVDQLKKIDNLQASHVLVMGDFNFKEIDWINLQVNASDQHPATVFFDTVQDLYLVQHVKKPTRHREGQKSSLLDLVLTNEEYMVENLQNIAPMGKSDHDGILWTYVCNSGVTTNNDIKERLNFKKGNYCSMNQYFSTINWEEEMVDMNCDETWNFLKTKYDHAVSENIPLKKQTKKNKPQWMTSKVKKSIKRKYAMYQRYRKTQNYCDYVKYKKQNNKTRKIVRGAQAHFEQMLMKQFKQKPKAFYSYVRSKQKVKAGISQLEKENGDLTETDEEAAEILSEFFQSVYTREPPGDVPEMTSRVEDEHELGDVEFTEEDVMEKLRDLKPDKCPGPDKIHPHVLKECCRQLAKPLFLLFRKSLDEGELPADWKTATVSPIFKKGSKTKAGNYRPVSLTCVPCKILETLIRERMLDHAKVHNLLNENQHGFMQGKSCLTNLLETLEDITTSLDEGDSMDIIFLDYQKAFDSVPHRRLLSKLNSYGYRGKVLMWIESFLIGRTQKVTVRGATSLKADVVSGVPQGSVLGPILFILYINDLPEHVSSRLKMFADDTKIYGPATTEDEVKVIQDDLEKLQLWSENWLLKFNAGKCKTMHMGSRNLNNNYHMGQTILDSTEEEKDLGMVITSDCKQSTQCSKAAAKGMNSLRVIRRTFKYIDAESFLILHKAYIRPHLEYCVQSWNPALQKDINALEKVQRRATKLVPQLKNQTYEERLQALGLYSLQRRRQRGDLIEVFKLLKGFEDVDSQKFFKLKGETSSTRGHALKIYKPTLHKNLNCRKNFFSQRIINDWNNLPAEVVNVKTISQFKKELDSHWSKDQERYGVLQAKA